MKVTITVTTGKGGDSREEEVQKTLETIFIIERYFQQTLGLRAVNGKGHEDGTSLILEPY
ncbi:hypothetical protein KW787_01075 [Candidatus Pacearchaeota archaeon]|nr:hypothetical protein [Candidatus Pacearchaeota archaeon]